MDRSELVESILAELGRADHYLFIGARSIGEGGETELSLGVSAPDHTLAHMIAEVIDKFPDIVPLLPGAILNVQQAREGTKIVDRDTYYNNIKKKEG